MSFKEYRLEDVTINHNSLRVPLSSKQRQTRQGIYPYYGAQGIIDFIDDFIFKGKYLLVAEDGANIETRKEDIARLTKDEEKFWVNNHAHILTSNEKSDIRYLNFLLNKMDISPYVTGSVQPKLNKANLNNIRLMLPSIEEQTTIANILSSLDDKIEVNNAINKKLEEMAQAIFKQWFVDFEFPNEEGKPYKSSGGTMVESELGMIPEGWKVSVMGDFITVADGTHASPKKQEEGYPLITSKHIKNNKLLIEEANLISEKDFIEVNKRSKVESKDILITMIGTVGVLYYVRDQEISFAIKNLGLFKSSEKAHFANFIYLYLSSNKMKEYIKSRHAGSTQQYISLTELRKIPMFISSPTLINKFNELVEPLFDLMTNNKEQNERLSKIRDTLLPKLMSGEICVQIDKE